MERELELKGAMFQKMETKSHGGGGWLLQIGGDQPGWDQDVIGEVTMQDITTQLPQVARAIYFEKTARFKKSGLHVEAECELKGRMGEALKAAHKRLRTHRRKHNSELAYQRIRMAKKTSVAGETSLCKELNASQIDRDCCDEQGDRFSQHLGGEAHLFRGELYKHSCEPL